VADQAQLPLRGFHVRKFANVGTDEAFVRHTLDLSDVLGATLIFGIDRERVQGSLGLVITEGLIPAFIKLREIRASVGKEVPVLDHQQMYEDFAGKLWKAYKEHMKQAAKAMGFEIGFLFQDDKRFEAGSKAFRQNNPAAPAALEGYLEDARHQWQTDLADFRNTVIEHPGAARSKFQKFYQPNFAEALFVEVWHTINEILAMFLELRLPPGVFLEWQPWNETGPKWPKRFRWQTSIPLSKGGS
jgi:hypothetical protein